MNATMDIGWIKTHKNKKRVRTSMLTLEEKNKLRTLLKSNLLEGLAIRNELNIQ